MSLNSNTKSSRKAKIFPQFSISSGNKPLLDLLEIQRKSFFDLLEYGIPHELAKTNVFRETGKNPTFTQELELKFNPETYKFISPNCTPKQAILNGKTYACKVYVQATLRIYQVQKVTSNHGKFIETSKSNLQQLSTRADLPAESTVRRFARRKISEKTLGPNMEIQVLNRKFIPEVYTKWLKNEFNNLAKLKSSDILPPHVLLGNILPASEQKLVKHLIQTSTNNSIAKLCFASYMQSDALRTPKGVSKKLMDSVNKKSINFLPPKGYDNSLQNIKEKGKTLQQHNFYELASLGSQKNFLVYTQYELNLLRGISDRMKYMGLPFVLVKKIRKIYQKELSYMQIPSLRVSALQGKKLIDSSHRIKFKGYLVQGKKRWSTLLLTKHFYSLLNLPPQATPYPPGFAKNSFACTITPFFIKLVFLSFKNNWKTILTYASIVKNVTFYYSSKCFDYQLSKVSKPLFKLCNSKKEKNTMFQLRKPLSVYPFGVRISGRVCFLRTADKLASPVLSFATPVGDKASLTSKMLPFRNKKLREGYTKFGGTENAFSSPISEESNASNMSNIGDVKDVQIFRPWIFLGELPLMTKRGHFILNGSPRVIVNQIARCPGIYFQEKRRGVGFEQEIRVSADLIPQRGPWLRIQSDWEGRFWARLKQEGRVKYTTLYEAFQEYEKEYHAPLVCLLNNSTNFSPFSKSETVSFQERKTKEDRQKKALIRLFKNTSRYSLGKLGRFRVNERVHSSASLSLSESIKLRQNFSLSDLEPLLKHSLEKLRIQSTANCFVSNSLSNQASLSTDPSIFRQFPDTLTGKLKKSPFASKDGSYVLSIDDSLLTKSIDSVNKRLAKSINFLPPRGYDNSFEKSDLATSYPLTGINYLLPRGYDNSIDFLPPVQSKGGTNNKSIDLKRNYLLMGKDIDAIHTCLERLLEGQGFTDDIDHLKNRFIRTSGKLLQQQFELGLYRLNEVIMPLLGNLLHGHLESLEAIKEGKRKKKNSNLLVQSKALQPEGGTSLPHSSSPLSIAKQSFASYMQSDALQGKKLMDSVNKSSEVACTPFLSFLPRGGKRTGGNMYGVINKAAFSGRLAKIDSNKLLSRSEKSELTETLPTDLAFWSSNPTVVLDKIYLYEKLRKSVSSIFPTNSNFPYKVSSQKRGYIFDVNKRGLFCTLHIAKRSGVPNFRVSDFFRSCKAKLYPLSVQSSRMGDISNSSDVKDVKAVSKSQQGVIVPPRGLGVDRDNFYPLTGVNYLPPKGYDNSKESIDFVNNESSIDRTSREKKNKKGILAEIAPFRWLRTSKPMNSAFREFFGSNPLSQYMDQTNPLAEITHKRRLSSMGPGGIKRETAGMEVRGIHPTHYGRVCPIETPEGKNAGLVNSPTVYGRVGNYGFLETPLYQVIENQVQMKRWAFFSAQQEENEESSLATCDTGLLQFNFLAHRPIPVQTANNPLAHFQQVERNRVGYRALSPVQTISIATALIPFLEHDDANRALMGSNMQRQAIPLLLPERPIVGTGFEPLVVVESGQALQATKLGCVSHVNANTIIMHTIHSTGKALPQNALRNAIDNQFFDTLRLVQSSALQSPSANFVQRRGTCNPCIFLSTSNPQGATIIPSKKNHATTSPLLNSIDELSTELIDSLLVPPVQSKGGKKSTGSSELSYMQSDALRTPKGVSKKLMDYINIEDVTPELRTGNKPSGHSISKMYYHFFNTRTNKENKWDNLFSLTLALFSESITAHLVPSAPNTPLHLNLVQGSKKKLLEKDLRLVPATQLLTLRGLGSSPFPELRTHKGLRSWTFISMGSQKETLWRNLGVIVHANTLFEGQCFALTSKMLSPSGCKAELCTRGLEVDRYTLASKEILSKPYENLNKNHCKLVKVSLWGLLRAAELLKGTKFDILSQYNLQNFTESKRAIRDWYFCFSFLHYLQKARPITVNNFVNRKFQISSFLCKASFATLVLAKQSFAQKGVYSVKGSIANKFKIGQYVTKRLSNVELFWYVKKLLWNTPQTSSFSYPRRGYAKQSFAQKGVKQAYTFSPPSNNKRKNVLLKSFNNIFYHDISTPLLTPYRVVLHSKHYLSTSVQSKALQPQGGTITPLSNRRIEFNKVSKLNYVRGSRVFSLFPSDQLYQINKPYGRQKIHQVQSCKTNFLPLWRKSINFLPCKALTVPLPLDVQSYALQPFTPSGSGGKKGVIKEGICMYDNSSLPYIFDVKRKDQATTELCTVLGKVFVPPRGLQSKALHEVAFGRKVIVSMHCNSLPPLGVQRAKQSFANPSLSIPLPCKTQDKVNFSGRLQGFTNQRFVSALHEINKKERDIRSYIDAPPNFASSPELAKFDRNKTLSSEVASLMHKKWIDMKNAGLERAAEMLYISKKIPHITKTRLHLCSSHRTFLLQPIKQELQLYQRSNQETCLNQRPIVQEGDWIQKGDFLADSSASHSGDLALGKNVTVAYMPWEGYNFEDAIVISDRLVSDDIYTSLHIERYEIKVNKNSQGKERITNRVPGTFDSFKHLDNFGIARISSWVQPGDILVGKVVELKRPLSPYERLAWELASRLSPASPEREKWLNKVWLEDISLRLPPGICGRVINSQIVSTEWSEQEQAVYPQEVHIYLAVKRKIQIGDKLAGRHGNKGIVSAILPQQDMPYIGDGSCIDMVLNPLGVPSRMNLGQIFECLLGLAGSQLGCNFKITPFDEIAGGEASRSLVFLKLYQCRLLYKQQWLFTPTFPGKSKLFDGRTGEPFENWVTVGQAYMLKLIHMVDHKIHARSTGPYSLFTRQPVRGRSRRGGQRLGEMEVWAVEGFGAAYTLQEFLTIKSDDLKARTALQKGFYKQNDVTFGKIHISPGNPEAFKVLVSELQALCLHIQM